MVTVRRRRRLPVTFSAANCTHDDATATEGVEDLTKRRVLCALLGLWPILAVASTPTATYGTYFGGTGDTNVAVAVAVGVSGEVIVAGYTTSPSLPGTAKALQPTKANGFANNRDVFIAKFDPTGRTLIWTTFLGGRWR